MTGHPRAQRIAEHLLRRACRPLPGGTRDERYREWAAELPAILHDPDIRFAPLRSARALSYAAGIFRSTRHLHRAVGGPAKDTRQPAIFPRPDGVLPAIAGIALWLLLVGLINIYHPQGFWVALAVAASIASELLIVVAIVRFIRWVRRRSSGAPHP